MDFRSQTQMASDQYRKDRDEAREEIKKLKEENEKLKKDFEVGRWMIKELNDRRETFYHHFTQYVYEFNIDCFDEWLATEAVKRIEGMPDEIIHDEEVCRVCGLPPSESVTGNRGPDGDDICEDCYDNCNEKTGEYNQGAG